MGTKRSLCCKAQEGWFGSLQNVTLAWCVVRVHGDYIQLQYIIVHPCNVHPLNIPKPWIPYLKMLGSSDKCLPNGPYGWGGKRWFGWHMVTCDTGESCSTSQLFGSTPSSQAMTLSSSDSTRKAATCSANKQDMTSRQLLSSQLYIAMNTHHPPVSLVTFNFDAWCLQAWTLGKSQKSQHIKRDLNWHNSSHGPHGHPRYGWLPVVGWTLYWLDMTWLLEIHRNVCQYSIMPWSFSHPRTETQTNTQGLYHVRSLFTLFTCSILGLERRISSFISPACGEITWNYL